MVQFFGLAKNKYFQDFQACPNSLGVPIFKHNTVNLVTKSTALSSRDKGICQGVPISYGLGEETGLVYQSQPL